MSGRAGRVLAIACLLGFCAVSAAQTTVEAPGVIERFHASLLELMRSAPSQSFEERRAQIEPSVRETYDLDYLSRAVLGGRTWGTLGEEEQARFSKTFADLTVTTYAARFNNFSGEKFVTVETREARRNRRLVRTELHTSDGERIGLDYLLQETEAGWRVVRVVANGVNELAIKRAEYAPIAKGQGVPRLVELLERQIDRLASN